LDLRYVSIQLSFIDKQIRKQTDHTTVNDMRILKVPTFAYGI
jgi:hypothetical protein